MIEETDSHTEEHDAPEEALFSFDVKLIDDLSIQKLVDAYGCLIDDLLDYRISACLAYGKESSEVIDAETKMYIIAQRQIILRKEELRRKILGIVIKKPENQQDDIKSLHSIAKKMSDANLLKLLTTYKETEGILIETQKTIEKNQHTAQEYGLISDLEDAYAALMHNQRSQKILREKIHAIEAECSRRKGVLYKCTNAIKGLLQKFTQKI